MVSKESRFNNIHSKLSRFERKKYEELLDFDHDCATAAERNKHGKKPFFTRSY